MMKTLMMADRVAGIAATVVRDRGRDWPRGDRGTGVLYRFRQTIFTEI